jgi:ribosomal protein L11 methylase PrmA
MNIGPAVLIEMAAEVNRVLRPGGVALLSGFEQEEAADVQAAYPEGILQAKANWRLLAYFGDRLRNP